MKLLLAPLMALLTACVSIESPQDHPVDRRIVANADFDRTWAAVIDWFGTTNVPMGRIQKDSGLITAAQFPAAQYGFLDCGKLSSGRYSDLNSNMNIIVRSLNNQQTQITVNLNGNAVAIQTGLDQRTVLDSKSIICTSTGLLEQSVHDYVLENL